MDNEAQADGELVFGLEVFLWLRRIVKTLLGGVWFCD